MDSCPSLIHFASLRPGERLSEIACGLLDPILDIKENLSLPVVKLDDAVKLDRCISESLFVLAFACVGDRREEFVFASRSKGHVFTRIG
jgi:hypothetical protein